MSNQTPQNQPSEERNNDVRILPHTVKNKKRLINALKLHIDDNNLVIHESEYSGKLTFWAFLSIGQSSNPAMGSLVGSYDNRIVDIAITGLTSLETLEATRLINSILGSAKAVVVKAAE